MDHETRRNQTTMEKLKAKKFDIDYATLGLALVTDDEQGVRAQDIGTCNFCMTPEQFSAKFEGIEYHGKEFNKLASRIKKLGGLRAIGNEISFYIAENGKPGARIVKLNLKKKQMKIIPTARDKYGAGAHFLVANGFQPIPGTQILI